jgi:hypothetical protein
MFFVERFEHIKKQNIIAKHKHHEDQLGATADSFTPHPHFTKLRCWKVNKLGSTFFSLKCKTLPFSFDSKSAYKHHFNKVRLVHS